MKFIISQSTLHAALTTCSKAISNGFVVATSCYRITPISVSSCNMEISITKSVTLETNDVFDVMIPGEQLRKLVASLPDQPLIFEVDEHYNLTIKSSNGKYKMVGYDGKEQPEIKTTADGTFGISGTTLKDAIDFTAFARRIDNTDSPLQYINVESGLQVMGYNGFCFAKYHTESDDARNMLLSAGIVSAIAILPDDDISVSYSQNSISFEAAGITVKGILTDAVYPDWKSGIGGLKLPNSVSVSRSELIASIKRVLMFANKFANEIKISFGDRLLTVSGWDNYFQLNGNETIPCTDGELEILINGQYVVDGLSKLDGELVHIAYSAPTMPVIFRDTPGSETYIMLAPIYHP